MRNACNVRVYVPTYVHIYIMQVHGRILYAPVCTILAVSGSRFTQKCQLSSFPYQSRILYSRVFTSPIYKTHVTLASSTADCR